MGYRTNYEIAAQTTDEKVLEDIKKLYGGLFNASVYDGRVYAIGSDSVKWYEHEFDMMNLSIKHPTVKFVLDGVGEEQGDLWQKIFLGGKMKYLLVDLVWPDEDSVEWV